MPLRLPLLGLASCVLAVSLLPLSVHADDIADKFAVFDTNHDGVLSGEELDAHPALRQLDLKGDGKITLEEAREAIAKMKEAGTLKQFAAQLNAPGQPGRQTFGDGHLVVEFLFKRFDKNGDGKLTPDELTDKALFDKLDLNKDGVITLDEAQQALGKVTSKGGLGRNLTQTNFSEADMAPLKEEPAILKTGERNVGRRVDPLTLKTLDGHSVPLAAATGDKATVLAFFSATCPISNKFGPELARLEKDYAGRHVSMFLVNIAPETKPEEVRQFVTSFGLKSPVVSDSALAAQRTLAATSTTEVFVLDASRTLVYRGAVNDQYGLGYSKNAPTKQYLRDAIEAVLKDSAPPIAATSAPGCALDAANAPKPATTALTYHHDISRILQANCTGCHHDGGIGPFPLDNLDDVKEHAAMIRKQITRGAMPPWFAAREPGQDHVWMNDCSLSDSDKTDLLTWLASDRPVGNPADAPVPRHFDADWSIGRPDAVLQISQPIAVKAEGTMPYQRAFVDTTFTEDRWVRGYEILPTARAVVHHVIVRVHPKGSGFETGNSAETFFAAYVPGNSSRVFPEGFAKRLPAGSRLSFEIHYTPNGHATQDQMKIGLLFSDHPPQYEIEVMGLAKIGLSIPPGEANHVETKDTVVPSNTMIMGFMPHMHVRGKAFKYELTTPDGKTETLLDIPHYDFNWQLAYVYAQPKFIPAGSKIRVTAIFDNSPNNPANPDPTKTVHWGQQTSDEMMIGYIERFTPYAGSKVAQK